MSEENTAIVVTRNLSIVFFEDSRLVNQVMDFLDLVATYPKLYFLPSVNQKKMMKMGENEKNQTE